MYVYAYLCIYIYICVCVYVYVYIYTHIESSFVRAESEIQVTALLVAMRADLGLRNSRGERPGLSSDRALPGPYKNRHLLRTFGRR